MDNQVIAQLHFLGYLVYVTYICIYIHAFTYIPFFTRLCYVVNKSCIMCELYKFIPLHHMEISLLLQFSAILNEAFIKIGSTELCSIV